MTVRVTKPEFNIRDKISQLEKPIGVTGAQLMKSETAREAGSILGVGRKNLCINGNFKCWQRGTSIASGAAGNVSNTYKYVTADRWQTYFYNSYARQEVVLPTGEQVYAMRETMQVIRNFMVNVIEDGGSIWYEGGDITISFWARTSSKRTGVSLGFYFYDDWAGSAYTFTNVRSNVIIEGHQWKHYTVTATIPGNTANRSHLAIEFDNNSYGSWYQLIAGEYWEFANVQIEKGSVATEFEYRSEAEELALCQRYYWQQENFLWLYSLDINHGYVRCNIFHPVEMRAAPTVTGTFSTAGSSNGFQSITKKHTIPYVNGPGSNLVDIQNGKWEAEL